MNFIKELHAKDDPTSNPWWDGLGGLHLLAIFKQCYPEFYLERGGIEAMSLDGLCSKLSCEIGGVGFYLSQEYGKEPNGMELPRYFLSVQLDLPEIEDFQPTVAFYKMLILIHYIKNYYPEVWVARGGKPELLPKKVEPAPTVAELDLAKKLAEAEKKYQELWEEQAATAERVQKVIDRERKDNQILRSVLQSIRALFPQWKVDFSDTSNLPIASKELVSHLQQMIGGWTCTQKQWDLMGARYPDANPLTNKQGHEMRQVISDLRQMGSSVTAEGFKILAQHLGITV